MPTFSLFAAITITSQLELYLCHKDFISLSCSVKVPQIPQALAFCPIETEALLAVGLSNGSVLLFNDSLDQLSEIKAHNEAVTCLSWDHKIMSYERNKWIVNNFPQFKRYEESD